MQDDLIHLEYQDPKSREPEEGGRTTSQLATIGVLGAYLWPLFLFTWCLTLNESIGWIGVLFFWLVALLPPISLAISIVAHLRIARLHSRLGGSALARQGIAIAGIESGIAASILTIIRYFEIFGS